jgi:hypothetical protein
MLTHKVLMKHMGSRLKSNLKTETHKIKHEGMIERKGICLRQLINVPGLRAIYKEGDDGESYIDILYSYPVYRKRHKIATLSSFGHLDVLFRRIGSTRATDRSTLVYNYFLPEDYLVTFKNGNYEIGEKFVPARFDEVSTLMFGSNNTFKGGTNITPIATDPLTRKKYKALVTKTANHLSGQLKLLGKTKVSMLRRKAFALRSDIKPKYIAMLRGIIQQQVDVTTIINFMELTHSVEFDHHNGHKVFKAIMSQEAPYGLSLMEYK